jgi:hypothetical protein
VPSDAEPRELVCIREGRRLLEQACSFEDVLKLRDQAQIARSALQMRGDSVGSINAAAEFKVRCERWLGQILKDRTPAKRGPKTEPELGNIVLPNSGPTLEELGIEKIQSSRWQAIAGIEEEVFEQLIEDIKASDKEITTAAFLRVGAKKDEADSPKPWSLHENLERLYEKIYAVYEDWPPEKYSILAVRLIDIGNELRDKGELCE